MGNSEIPLLVAGSSSFCLPPNQSLKSHSQLCRTQMAAFLAPLLHSPMDPTDLLLPPSFLVASSKTPKPAGTSCKSKNSSSPACKEAEGRPTPLLPLLRSIAPALSPISVAGNLLLSHFPHWLHPSVSQIPSPTTFLTKAHRSFPVKTPAEQTKKTGNTRPSYSLKTQRGDQNQVMKHPAN